jgi:hypothetical protein
MSNGAESRLGEDGLKKYQYLFQFLHIIAFKIADLETQQKICINSITV